MRNEFQARILEHILKFMTWVTNLRSPKVDSARRRHLQTNSSNISQNEPVQGNQEDLPRSSPTQGNPQIDEDTYHDSRSDSRLVQPSDDSFLRIRRYNGDLVNGAALVLVCAAIYEPKA